MVGPLPLFCIQSRMITRLGNNYMIKGRMPFLKGQFKEMSFPLANPVFFLLMFTSTTLEYTIQSCKLQFVTENSTYGQFWYFFNTFLKQFIRLFTWITEINLHLCLNLKFKLNIINILWSSAICSSLFIQGNYLFCFCIWGRNGHN